MFTELLYFNFQAEKQQGKKNQDFIRLRGLQCTPWVKGREVEAEVTGSKTFQ
jgi:hypothetical protein